MNKYKINNIVYKICKTFRVVGGKKIADRRLEVLEVG